MELINVLYIHVYSTILFNKDGNYYYYMNKMVLKLYYCLFFQFQPVAGYQNTKHIKNQ